jgi:hypothetical protein
MGNYKKYIHNNFVQDHWPNFVQFFSMIWHQTGINACREECGAMKSTRSGLESLASSA